MHLLLSPLKCTALTCLSEGVCDPMSAGMFEVLMELPLQQVCCCVALAGLLGVHIAHAEVSNSLVLIFAMASLLAMSCLSFA